ncbi:MAG: ABC transporter permease subunit [Alphaproteobacteria bacterium]|jgi:ABC-2 type transport system permease protein|nr:ABC transporter permease subunit [Alphaproteobacteria bacterium]
MRTALLVTRRELEAYFTSPLAYVFIIIFLALGGALTFYLGGFFERGRADLAAFFVFHPWLYLFLIPALGMRLWAEERKSGTLEFLLTLPLGTTAAVVGKFLAAWLFAGIALLLTFPLWITVNWLGDPDNGAIAAGYLGSWLMAGGFLALSGVVSALTKNQVIAFVGATALCFLFMVSGLPLVQGVFQGWAPAALVDVVASFSFLTNFDAIQNGVVDGRHLVFFGSLIVAALAINVAVVELNKGA